MWFKKKAKREIKRDWVYKKIESPDYAMEAEECWDKFGHKVDVYWWDMSYHFAYAYDLNSGDRNLIVYVADEMAWEKLIPIFHREYLKMYKLLGLDKLIIAHEFINEHDIVKKKQEIETEKERKRIAAETRVNKIKFLISAWEEIDKEVE
jgi:hypothetical protein